MTASEAYRLFSALKLHFETNSYDYFKYQGKSKSINPAAFERRKDKSFFYRLAKKPNLEEFLVANFIDAHGPIWVGDLFNTEAEGIFDNWRGRMESITYLVKQERTKYLTNCLEGMMYRNISNYPLIVDMILKRLISYETALVIEETMPFMDSMDLVFKWDPIWQNLRQKLVKYKPFLSKYLQEYVGINIS